jgi:hypothetical protein
MCYQPKCNWLRHLLGLCDHYRQVSNLHKQIVDTRSMTNKELKKFNQELNLIIKDENIRLTLTNIKKVSQV